LTPIYPNPDGGVFLEPQEHETHPALQQGWARGEPREATSLMWAKWFHAGKSASLREPCRV